MIYLETIEHICMRENQVPQNGYWIECVPVTMGNTDQAKENEGAMYRAAIASIPEANVLARSPDSAIQQLRDKLASVRHEYCKNGKDLPAHDNPVKPPRNSKSTKGWISIYVKMNDCCHNS